MCSQSACSSCPRFYTYALLVVNSLPRILYKFLSGGSIRALVHSQPLIPMRRIHVCASIHVVVFLSLPCARYYDSLGDMTHSREFFSSQSLSPNVCCFSLSAHVLPLSATSGGRRSGGLGGGGISGVWEPEPPFREPCPFIGRGGDHHHA